MTQVQRRAVRGVMAVAGMVLATALVGCGNFFVCDKASCTSNGTTPTGPAGDVAYVSNNVSANTSINGYTLGKTTLVAATGSPYPINNVPTAMVVSRNNGFLYMASAVTTANQQSGIYGFTIGTGGALSVLNVGNAFAAQSSVAAMDVSPDGNWLIISTAYITGIGATLQAYPLNATSGAVGPLTVSSPAGVSYSTPNGLLPQVSALKIAPSGQFLSVALGTGGVITFPFNTSTGVIGGPNGPAVTSFSSGGAFDLAIDSNNYLYIATTNNIFVYLVTAGVPNTNPVTAATQTAAGAPFAIALDGTSYLYASALSGSSNLIYMFSISNGILKPLSTATIAAPPTTTKLAVDSTGAYLLAAGYDTTSGLKLYGITSGTGVLTSLDTAPTGGTSTNAPTALALSH